MSVSVWSWWDKETVWDWTWHQYMGKSNKLWVNSYTSHSHWYWFEVRGFIFDLFSKFNSMKNYGICMNTLKWVSCPPTTKDIPGPSNDRIFREKFSPVNVVNDVWCLLKVVLVGGLIHILWHHIWNIQGFSPLVWDSHQILPSHCAPIAELLQHTDTKQIWYGKPKFRESLSPDDIAKSQLEHGTIVKLPITGIKDEVHRNYSVHPWEKKGVWLRYVISWKGSLNLGFPCLLYCMPVCCDISTIAGKNMMKILHQG